MTPWVSAGSNTNSSSVLSPFAPTRASIQSVTPMPAAIALRSWGQRSPLTPWFHRVIHELRRTPRMPGRLTVTVPLVDIGGNTLPHLHRVWLARLELHIRINTKRTASQAIRESSTSNTETRSRDRSIRPQQAGFRHSCMHFSCIALRDDSTVRVMVLSSLARDFPHPRSPDCKSP